ncbi:small ribosomal subunit protein mS23 isoform X2 [Epargyreus clarus]|uniref:small ribosomal subunit protein mS23 isoform X2 n=1 Tax=Epargyreus clarus TaxID=520877 RepID=UPI003C2FA537
MATSRLERIGTIFTRAEGLLKRGAMKPDDRPLWFDVYKAFPPIRPILYKEDVVRAKFHASGHGFAAMNMQNPSGETQIKKLMQQYEKLKTEGVPENELIEKSASNVSSERTQEVAQNKIPKASPETVTSQVLTEVNIKNIFKE